MDLVLLEKFRDLADIADKNKTANLGVEILHRVNELQHEARGIQYRVRDVAQDYNLRLGLLASVQLDVKRHATILQVSSERLLDVEGSAGGLFSPPGQAFFQPLRQTSHGFVHPPYVIFGVKRKTLVGERGALAVIGWLNAVLSLLLLNKLAQ